MNPRQLEFFDVVGHVRVDLACEVDKTPFRVGIDARSQLVERDVQRSRQRSPAFANAYATRIMHFFRIGPDGLHRHAHRQRTAGTVGNHAT
ncbi:hypothetical protein D3C73_1009900 [compost metagenome]